MLLLLLLQLLPLLLLLLTLERALGPSRVFLRATTRNARSELIP